MTIAEVAAACVYAAGITTLVIGVFLMVCGFLERVIDKLHLFSALARNLREYIVYRREFQAWRRRHPKEEAE